MPSDTHSFNVILKPIHYAKLTTVAAHLEISRGALLRRLISLSHGMVILGAPACSNGDKCLVPHMHPPPATQPTPETTQS